MARLFIRLKLALLVNGFRRGWQQAIGIVFAALYALPVAMLGAWGLTPAAAERVGSAVPEVPTEASAMALRGALGGYGEHPIRNGRRTVPVSPLGAIVFFFDPAAAMASAARLAAAVVDCGSLDEAQAVLTSLDVRTELDWEREAAS